MPLLARFDAALLRPPPVPQAPPAHEAAAPWAPWAVWCRDGLGTRRAPWWRPGLASRVDLPLAVALLEAAPDADVQPALDALQQALDGSHALRQAGGAVAALALRLRVKLSDACWWRARQPADPWDCGTLRHEPRALERLAGFAPRRATLMVVHGLPQALLAPCLATLKDRQAAFRQPVRLLVVVSSATEWRSAVPDWQRVPVFHWAAAVTVAGSSL